MATIFSHALVGCTIVAAFPRKYRTSGVYALAAFTAILPDFDYFGFVRRIPYGSLWGHRGMTHSILFAVFAALLASIIANRSFKFRWGTSILFFLTTISHGLLDACTSGGLGVAFYSPYNTARYFFPWRPIRVSPMGLNFFSERGLVVLISEFFWIVIPCFFLLILLASLRTKKFRQYS